MFIENFWPLEFGGISKIASTRVGGDDIRRGLAKYRNKPGILSDILSTIHEIPKRITLIM